MPIDNKNMKKIVIRPEYSAVAPRDKNRPSASTKAAISVFKESNVSRVCEVGCGLLANTPHILKAFPYVILTDSREQYNRIRERLTEISRKHNSFKIFIECKSFQKKKLELDGAIITNVIHILPRREERIEVLKGVHENLKKEGIIFVNVPHSQYFYRKLVKTAIPYKDGYAMRRNDYYTFYKDISFETLKEYVEEVGFKVERRISLPHCVAFIARKAVRK